MRACPSSDRDGARRPGLPAGLLLALLALTAGCGRNQVLVRGEVFRKGDLPGPARTAGGMHRMLGDRDDVMHPLPGVEVTAYQAGKDQWDPLPLAATTSGSDGRYELSFAAHAFPAERLFLVFAREGYLADRQAAIFFPGRRYHVDTTLVPSTPEDRRRYRKLTPLQEYQVRQEHGFNERLADPLRVASLSFLHSLVHVPPMEAGYTRSGGSWRLDAGQQFFAGKASGQAQPGQVSLNGYRAIFNDMYIQVQRGLLSRLDLQAVLDLGKTETQKRTDIQIFRDNDPADALFVGDTPAGNELVGEGYHLRGVGGRLRWMAVHASRAGFALALLGGANAGIGSEHFVSKGSVDSWGALAVTQDLGASLLHVNAGYVAMGPQGVFSDRGTGKARIEVDDVIYGGAALAVPLPEVQGCTVVAQVQGHTNAFRQLDFQDQSPALALLGARYRVFEFVLEGLAGTGLNGAAADAVFGFNIAIGF